MLLTPKRSDDIKTKIQAAVEEALREREVSARRVSLDVVGNDGLIRDIRAGRLPGVDRLDALFEYLGLEFYFGPRRTKATPGAFAEPAQGMSEYSDREALRAGYLPIPWHALSPRPKGLAASPVAFAKSWLDGTGLEPAALAAVKPEPGADGRDTVALVDITAPRRGGPAAWCYREGTRVAIARIQFEPGVTVFLPDRPEGKARVLMSEDRSLVTLIGRVVWSGQLIPGEGPIAPPPEA